MTAEVIAVALIAGLAGGVAAAAVIGGVQAWMARGRGGGVRHVAHRDVGGPFDRFTDRSKRVLALAQDEAIRQNHNYIGTEHLLAGLLRDGDTVAARALTSLGIELVKVRTALEHIVGRGDQPISPSEITLSPRTKKVIELSIDEARRLGHAHLGPEHLLLGLIREGEGIASGIIESLGVNLSTLRAKVMELLAEPGAPASASHAAPPPTRTVSYGPFSRFSDRAKRVLALAQDEAIGMGHTNIGPEHLLLGLARLGALAQPDTPMKRIFGALGLTWERIHTELAKVIPPAAQPSLLTEITLSPETKAVLQFVHESTLDKLVEPEHLLLAIVRDKQSFGAQLLTRLGVTPEQVRAAVGH